MEYKAAIPDPDGEFPAAVPEYFFYMIFQMARRRDASLDALLKPLNLSANRARILTILRRVEGCSMNALANFTTIERTTLTREVDHLVAMGLISRAVPPTDRRRVHLTLTPAGEALYHQGVPLVRTATRQALAGIDLGELRGFTRLLQAVMRNLLDDGDWAEDIISFGRPHRKARLG